MSCETLSEEKCASTNGKASKARFREANRNWQMEFSRRTAVLCALCVLCAACFSSRQGKKLFSAKNAENAKKKRGY
jgi:hypothetical protein